MRIDEHLLVRLEFLLGAIDKAPDGTHIDLGDLLSAYVRRIPDRKLQCDGIAVNGGRKTGINEPCITQAVGSYFTMGVSFFEKKNWNSWFRVTYYATNTWKDYRLSSLQYTLRHLIGCDPGVSALFSAIGNDYLSQRYPQKSGIRHLRKATEYITSNLHRPITCSEIAARSGVSLNYLNRLFCEQYAMTLNAYINHLRIREAKKLIERTDIPLSELYRQVGYQTPQNFSKQFVRLAGCTPSTYRKQLKGIHLEKNFEKNYNVVSGFPEET